MTTMMMTDNETYKKHTRFVFRNLENITQVDI